MKIGVDYYPEQVDSSLWADDARRMHEAGIRVVRLAEFAWCRLEPTEGVFDFGWLDEAIAGLVKHGMDIVLGTPTNTPPNWLVTKCPDVLPVDYQLRPVRPGTRGHRCYNSPSLQRHTRRILGEMTSHYAGMPGVIGWQIDNEMSLNMCHCDHCRQGFRAWVREKYVTLQHLNDAWGTVVWSGEYSQWDQLETPLGNSLNINISGNASMLMNPAYLMDYVRYQNEAAVSYLNLQVDILRANCPGHFVTHNIWSYNKALDYYKLFERLDFASIDNYPNNDPNNINSSGVMESAALALDLTRGVKKKNFWVMEQLSGPTGGWGAMSRTPQPGMIRGYSWQAIARGADAVVHFRWRSALIGAEQFWHGVLDHSNVPGRRYHEFMRLCGEVNQWAPRLSGTEVRNDIAILHSHEQSNALRIQPQAEGFDYFSNLNRIHQAFLRLGAGTDLIDLNAEIQPYRLVVAPHIYLLDAATAAKLDAYVRDGGILVLTNRTGVKDENNACWMRPLPGLLSQCAGITVAEYDPIGADVHTVSVEGGRDYRCSQWCDVIDSGGAEVCARYASGYFTGSPAVTLNHYGKGCVYYIGTVLEEDFYRDFFEGVLRQGGFTYWPALPEGVEVSLRENEEEQFLFVFNRTMTEKQVEVAGAWSGFDGAEAPHGALHLSPFDMRILHRRHKGR